MEEGACFRKLWFQGATGRTLQVQVPYLGPQRQQLPASVRLLLTAGLYSRARRSREGRHHPGELRELGGNMGIDSKCNRSRNRFERLPRHHLSQTQKRIPPPIGVGGRERDREPLLEIF